MKIQRMKENKNRIWEAYQKEIADNNYYFARSCIRQNFFSGSRRSFLKNYQAGGRQKYL